MLKTREHVIYHKLPYFPLNLEKIWEKLGKVSFPKCRLKLLFFLQRKMKKNQERIGGEDDKEIQDQAHGR